LDGISVRVPTINVSLVDLNVLVEKDVTVEAIHAAMKKSI
jgi:glyceraldehyde 3-phosphate dehydrogenase